MEKKPKPWWVYALIIIFITLLLTLGFFFLIYIISIPDPYEPPNPPLLFCKYTKLNESHLFEVNYLDFKNSDPLEWQIISEDGVFLNGDQFPTESGVPSTGKSGNETLTWFDDNTDNKFNPGDTLVLKGDMSYLEGKIFKIYQNYDLVYKQKLE